MLGDLHPHVHQGITLDPLGGLQLPPPRPPASIAFGFAKNRSAHIFLCIIPWWHATIGLFWNDKNHSGKNDLYKWFSCCHLNVNSILAHDKLSLLTAYNSTQHYDILCISETYSGFKLSLLTLQIVNWIPIIAIEMFHTAWNMWSSFFVLK